MQGAVRLADSTGHGGVTADYRLEFRAVSQAYRRRGSQQMILSNVDLAVGPGEFVALTGASGAGKTTMLELAAGLQRPTRGSVLFGASVQGSRALQSLDLGSMSEARLAEWRLTKVGVLFRDHTLISTLAAAENVAMPLLLAGAPRSEALQRATSLLGRLGLGSEADLLPGELSRGQRYRLVVARALVNAPQLLVADEPTAGLDSVAADDVMQLLTRLVEDDGLTVLLATHDARAAAYAPAAYRLAGGHLERA